MSKIGKILCAVFVCLLLFALPSFAYNIEEELMSKIKSLESSINKENTKIDRLRKEFVQLQQEKADISAALEGKDREIERLKKRWEAARKEGEERKYPAGKTGKPVSMN
jgi:septal ring factor EnvC (AmiA/AmiB activator)